MEGAGPVETAAIRLERLTKDYGSVRALTDVDLTVERGQLFGFLGPNGAGKTTTIRVLLDLIRPTAGRAEVLGFDAQRDTVEVRRRVGYLPGDPRMYEGMSALDYFRLVASLRDGQVDAAYRERLVESLQLDPTRRIGTLSRGNRQKVGIVQALMSRPELLVLDEPTSGLDPLMQEVVEGLLREVVKDGRSVFFSSHDLAEVEQVCHRVAMLRGGCVIDVFDLAERRRIAAQRVTVTFAGSPPRDGLDGIDGAPLLSFEGDRAVFETHDRVDALLKRLAMYTVAAIETHKPTLEELFLSYYEQPDAPSAEAADGEGRHAAAS